MMRWYKRHGGYAHEISAFDRQTNLEGLCVQPILFRYPIAVIRDSDLAAIDSNTNDV